MKSYKFKIGSRELELQAANVDIAFMFAQAWKDRYNWYGKIIFLGSKD